MLTLQSIQFLRTLLTLGRTPLFALRVLRLPCLSHRLLSRLSRRRITRNLAHYLLRLPLFYQRHMQASRQIGLHKLP